MSIHPLAGKPVGHVSFDTSLARRASPGGTFASQTMAAGL